MTTATRPLPPHGTLHRRKIHRCDCQPCRTRDRDYTNSRTRLIAYGQWQPYIDAEPTRRHVRALMDAGLGIQTIGRLARVPSGTMTKLLYGERRRGLTPSRRIRPETAARLLAVRPSLDLLAPSARINATGTRRRLQALAAIGWPQRAIANQTGLGYHLINEAIRGDVVEAATARAVRDAYERLWNADPATRGAEQRWIDAAKRLAEREGWAPPAAWDDIDDPHEEPLTGEETPRYVALAEDGLWLEQQQGYSRQHAAERLGVTKSHLDQCISRWRRAQAREVAA